jgi:hypothetical protein
MKKALRYSVLTILGLMLGAGVSVAGDLATAPDAAQASTLVCAAQQPASAPAVVMPAQAPDVPFMLSPEPAAICPLLGCANDEYCRRDRDCTTAPGGVCNLFCPTQGCCAYPAP